MIKSRKLKQKQEILNPIYTTILLSKFMPNDKPRLNVVCKFVC